MSRAGTRATKDPGELDCPGWILTDRQVTRAKKVFQDKFDDYLSKQCLKEFLLPPDVARMALFLAADDSRMITGQTFVVDGGVV